MREKINIRVACWRLTRRISTVLVGLVVRVGCIASLGSSPVMAAASCNIVCNEINPSSAGYEDSHEAFRMCTDAITIHTERNDLEYVELRYSTKCRMAWARALEI